MKSRPIQSHPGRCGKIRPQTTLDSAGYTLEKVVVPRTKTTAGISPSDTENFASTGRKPWKLVATQDKSPLYHNVSLQTRPAPNDPRAKGTIRINALFGPDQPDADYEGGWNTLRNPVRTLVTFSETTADGSGGQPFVPPAEKEDTQLSPNGGR
ncbi:hypothetical protein FQR65_LT13767 [Abscondita terminalis]|nr:hypothetical protein FQR65_LT13767 [Abscondita terminalis]